jgi:hypothetical protein
MPRCGFVEHNGKQIFVLDIDGCPPEEFEEMLAESARIIRKCQYSSLLVLARGGNRMPIPTNKGMFIEYLAQNAPHIKASAVCGLPATERAMFNAIMTMAQRSVKFFETEDQAKDWLATVK